ncbi:hypothetical protein H0H92_011211 [Tricholoma furcatifolium]|nr:hypothetical protein H0H92_011211 [Tricholoma furcatifolium]
MCFVLELTHEQEVLENRLATLESGRAAVATATGISAQIMAIVTIASSGDNIIVSAYMQNHGFQSMLEQFGVNTKLVYTVNPGDFAAAIDSHTKAIFVESISGPHFVIHSIQSLAEVAHAAQIPLIVDNTLGMSGFLVRPIDHGADIIIESVTKRINGHGLALGGVVIDSGNFDWKQSDKFPGLSKPSAGHHAVVYADVFSPTAFAMKLRSDILRDLGPSLEPFSAFFMLQALETLSLRGERQCENAQALARWLNKHVKVSSVYYLGLEEHPFHTAAKLYLKEGLFGAVLTFTVNGGASAVDAVISNLNLASYQEGFGDTKTSVFKVTGVVSDFTASNGRTGSATKGQVAIRVSVGIEAIEDITADFAIALSKVD